MKNYISIGIMAAFCISVSGCSDGASSVEIEQKTDEKKSVNIEEVEAMEEVQNDAEHTDESTNIEGNENENENTVDNIEANREGENDTSIDMLKQYDDILKKIVAGEEMISGDGEAYDYSFAMNPAYALHDINGDSIPELLVTGDKDSNWHVYTIYFLKDGEALNGGHFNGYVPDDDLWIYGFDFLIDAYIFSIDSGFTQVWRIEYPAEGESDTTITYSEKPDKQKITDNELDTILSKEILEPADIDWIILDESTSIIGNNEDENSNNDSISIIENVTWNNDAEVYEFPAQDETKFTFYMSDGKEQVISANYEPMITGKDMVDIDNDGEDEYVIYAYFGNTAGEFEFPYIFKCVNGEIIQLFPTKDIPKLAEPTWEGMTRGDISNTAIVKVEQGGITKNALEVSLVEKNEGVVDEIYHEILVYNNDHWEEYK